MSRRARRSRRRRSSRRGRVTQSYGPRDDYREDVASSALWLVAVPVRLLCRWPVEDWRPGVLLAGMGVVGAYGQAVRKIHRWTLHADGRLELFAVIGRTTVSVQDVVA